ncbi:MAG: polysaccharide pyruvyl transferase family protein [Candidatus Acidiferrales bacterium]
MPDKLHLSIDTRQPRIALLTPYTGANLGDASIQDAMIANIGLRLPGVEFSGITLNCDNFMERHGPGAFPLLAHLQVHGTFRVSLEDPNEYDSFATMHLPNGVGIFVNKVKTFLKSTPTLRRWLKVLRRIAQVLARIPREVSHSIAGYRFLRTHHLVIVCGGGQLNEEWGGAWQHPFGLFKWAMLAKLARVPYAVSSVGAVKITSAASRMFVTAALRMACYRSYRDKHSKDIVTALLGRADRDPVVPDLAFSIPSSALAPPASIRPLAQGRAIIAVSPIAYYKPGMWFSQDAARYQLYVQKMAEVISQLLGRGYFLVLVWSQLGDDKSVIPELLGRLDDRSKQRLARQLHIPAIKTWSDLVATLRDVDLLIASRLHSTILGFMSETPTIAISFDPKVDWVMEDVGQTDYLLQIRDFSSSDVIDAVYRLELRKDVVVQQIASYRRGILPLMSSQYDSLATLAIAQCRRR